MELSPYNGPLAVTLAYMLLYYAFVIRVAQVKNRLAVAYRERGEKFDRYYTQDREMLAADRLHLNTLEQMPPFVVLLWLYAVFVSPFGATVAGGIYVVARASYPLMMGARMGRGVRVSIILATGPGYAVILYFVGALLWRLLLG